jgi:hypothetical protein
VGPATTSSLPPPPRTSGNSQRSAPRMHRNRPRERKRAIASTPAHRRTASKPNRQPTSSTVSVASRRLYMKKSRPQRFSHREAVLGISTQLWKFYWHIKESWRRKRAWNPTHSAQIHKVLAKPARCYVQAENLPSTPTVLPDDEGQRGAPSASRPGLQSVQFPAHTGPAGRNGKLGLF